MSCDHFLPFQSISITFLLGLWSRYLLPTIYYLSRGNKWTQVHENLEETIITSVTMVAIVAIRSDGLIRKQENWLALAESMKIVLLFQIIF